MAGYLGGKGMIHSECLVKDIRCICREFLLNGQPIRNTSQLRKFEVAHGIITIQDGYLYSEYSVEEMLIGMSFIPKHAWSSDRPRAILNYVENVASLKLFTIGKLRERTYAYLAAKNVKCLTRSGFGQLPF